MKYIAIFLCVVGLAMAVGYTDWQQGAAEGLNIGFKMGQAYEQAQKGINVSGFNTQVDVYNAWVREHFGEDRMLLMQKLNSAPVDLQQAFHPGRITQPHRRALFIRSTATTRQAGRATRPMT